MLLQKFYSHTAAFVVPLHADMPDVTLTEVKALFKAAESNNVKHREQSVALSEALQEY